MNIGQRIKNRRKKIGLSVDDIAEVLGKDRSTIYRYESNDIEKLPTTILEPLAEILKTTPAYLMGWEDEAEQELSTLYDNIIPIKTRRIPLLGEIACGEPIYTNEDRESYVEVGTDVRADFCLKARGDSMINARIFDGDIVFIRSQPDVDNGEIAAVIIGEEATLKRVYKYKNRIELRAENPLYKPLNYEGYELDKIRILGKAIAFQSDVI